MKPVSRIKFDPYLLVILLVPFCALWLPLHHFVNAEFNGTFVNAMLFVILVMLIVLAVRKRRNTVLEVESLAFELNARILELESSHDLVTRIDIETRREVGVWLHGEVQSFHLAMARRMRSGDVNGRDLADEMDKFSEETIRAFAHQLYPPVLEVSLDLALRDLLEGRATYETSSALSIEDYSLQDLRILPFRIRYILYRIIEECVLNAEKKSSTKHISVELKLKDDFIELNVTDDGGPVPEPLVRGLGTRLINDYLASVGGNFHLTTFGPGARLTAQFQLREKSLQEK